MIKPMLAHKWKADKITFPCFVQPKLNGVRGIYSPKHFMQSRYGEVWKPEVIAHVLNELDGFKYLGLHFDGEFYSHGMSLQNINSRISVIRNSPHVEASLINYCIFDVLIDEPFYRRNLVLHKLKHLMSGCKHIKIVKTEEIASQSEADYFYNQWRNVEGFEGLMYRLATAPYGFASRCGNKENRWYYLQKRKGTQDLEATVVGLKEMLDSKNKMPKGTLGAFVLQTDSGVTFDAGSGLTDSDRAKYWALGDEMIGTKVRIEFEMFSDGGTPLKPIVACVDYVE